MHVCFPVEQDQGLASPVYNHFGSAPLFMIVDTATGLITALPNGNRNHTPGACNPLQALRGRSVDAVVVGGIGPGARTRLAGLGIRMYRSRATTIGQNLELLQNDKLDEYPAAGGCGSHASGGHCSHS